MEKLKVITIVGTRPEIIRLSEVIKACDRRFEHILVYSNQYRDYPHNEVFFKELDLRAPDHYLNVMGNTMSEKRSNLIDGAWDVLTKIKPDALLVLGDVNSALSAIAAKRLHIPTFHMEAGNPYFEQRVSDEIHSMSVDNISDFNLPYTENSRRYLLSQGFHNEQIYVTGSPIPEVLHMHMDSITGSSVLNDFGLKPDKYIFVSIHREEHIDDDCTFQSLLSAINYIAEKYDYPVVCSTNQCSWQRITELGLKIHTNVQLIKTLGFFAYNKLQMNAWCVLSDSGTLSEESAILNFPGLLIRINTGRFELLDKGAVIISNLTQHEIEQSINLARGMRSINEIIDLAKYYRENNVSVKVVNVIQRYADVIDKVV